MRTYFKFALLVFCLLPLTSLRLYAQKENLKVFDQWVEWSNGENMLQLCLNQQAFDLLDQRGRAITELRTIDDWKLRREKVKKVLAVIVGQFPEKTPLNPRITGIIHKEGFRVEKILYESMPGFYVTGCLFIPEGGADKKPAVLNVIGHSNQSFRRDTYQNVILNMVKKGFIVFAIDPIGQGERLQYYDPDKKRSAVGGATSEHSYIANQCFLAGYSLSKYFIWDGVRGIDYLITRKEVDPERIGLTGLSGGGTQTSFIGAFDERVLAAAPSCYITGYRRLLESIGPQDGEQNFFHGLAEGMDHADLLVARAPKPLLIVSTTRDFFSIQGARETYDELKNVYSVFGEAGNISMTEADYEHGFIQKNNEATYTFFQKELGNPGDPTEEKIQVFPEDELNVTPTGQLSTSFKGKTVFDLNQPEVDKLAAALDQSRKNNSSHLEAVKRKAITISGYIAPKAENKSIYRGCYQRDGYSIAMYALEGDGKYVVPLLLVIPNSGGSHSPVIYIHPEGKEKDISAGTDIEKLVKRGFMVAVPDLLGIGETQSRRTYNGSHGYEAQLIGRSIVGIQAGDIVRVVSFLRGLPDIREGSINAIAFGELCPALLHAAAFESRITGVALIDAPVSYSNIAQTRMYNYSQSFHWGVAGALKSYDLPDLAACIAPRKLVYMGLLNGNKETASKDLVSNQMAFPELVYAKSSPDHLKIMPTPGDGMGKALVSWLEE